MKQLKQLLILLTISLSIACNKSSLEGKKYYLLTGLINYSSYYANLKEVEFNFISEDKVEAKMTLYADAFGYRIITNDSKESESKIYHYKFDKGILELPDLKQMAKLEELTDGSLKTNEGEYFYTSSIVPLLGKQEALKRIEESSKNGMAKIFKNFLSKPKQTMIKKQGNRLIFNSNIDNSQAKKELTKDYNKIIQDFGAKYGDMSQLQGSLGEKYKIIEELKSKLNISFNKQDSDYNEAVELFENLKNKLSELGNKIDTLIEENKQINKNN